MQKHLHMHRHVRLLLQMCIARLGVFRLPPAPPERKLLFSSGMPAGQLPSARWRKSSASNPTGSCVEIAEVPGGAIAVRNSRDADGPALIYPRAEMAAFLRGLKNGEFDVLAGLFASVGSVFHAEPNASRHGGRSVISCCVRPTAGWVQALPVPPLSAEACR